MAVSQGLQDVLITKAVMSQSGTDGYSVLTAWQNEFAADACFIKVLGQQQLLSLTTEKISIL